MLHVLFSCKWECEWEGDKTQQMFKTNLYGANQNPIIFCASIIFFYLKKVFDFKFIINDFSVINTHTLLKQIFQITIQTLAKEVVEKVSEIDSEVLKTERTLYCFLPESVLQPIKLKESVAEHFDCVTIFHADIVGFNDLTSDCTPTQVY